MIAHLFTSLLSNRFQRRPAPAIERILHNHPAALSVKSCQGRQKILVAFKLLFGYLPPIMRAGNGKIPNPQAVPAQNLAILVLSYFFTKLTVNCIDCPAKRFRLSVF